MFSTSIGGAWPAASTQMMQRMPPPERPASPHRDEEAGSGQAASTVSDYGTNGLVAMEALSSLMLQGQTDTAGSGGEAGFQPPAFEDIDADGDGSITQTEMQTYGQSVRGDQDTDKSDELFTRLDTDGDGSITADEKTAFDDQRAASRPSGQGPGGPGAPPAPEASVSAQDGTESSAQLTALMQQLMTALEAYNARSSSTTETAPSTTSVAA